MKITSWCRANAMPLIAVLSAAVKMCIRDRCRPDAGDLLCLPDSGLPADPV